MTTEDDASTSYTDQVRGIDEARKYSWQCPFCDAAVGADTVDGATGYAESHLEGKHDMTLEEYKEGWPYV